MWPLHCKSWSWSNVTRKPRYYEQNVVTKAWIDRASGLAYGSHTGETVPSSTAFVVFLCRVFLGSCSSMTLAASCWCQHCSRYCSSSFTSSCSSLFCCSKVSTRFRRRTEAADQRDSRLLSSSCSSVTLATINSRKESYTQRKWRRKGTCKRGIWQRV